MTIIKALKILGPSTCCTKKPFGYRVAHLFGYILSSINISKTYFRKKV